MGAVSVIIGQPPQVDGYTLDEAILELGKTFTLSKPKITVMGIGPGNEACLTAEAITALTDCDAVIGARSVVESLHISKPIYYEYLPEKVRAVLDCHPTIRHAAVVMRGDVGFTAVRKSCLRHWTDMTCECFPESHLACILPQSSAYPGTMPCSSACTDVMET